MTEYITIPDVVAVHETDKALLVEIEGETHWVPKSQISEDSEVFEDGMEGDLVVSEWFAQKNDLPY